MQPVKEIFIDIETCPSQEKKVRDQIAETIECPGNITKAESIAIWHEEKKPALIEKAMLKTSFDGAFGHVAVIGLAFDDEPPVTLFSEDWLADEKIILETLMQTIAERVNMAHDRRPTFVGHNVLDFDLRFLFQRHVILGVRPHSLIPYNASRYDDSVFDTMTRWGKYGDYTSMDKLCTAFGIEGKGDMDGSMVWDAVREGRIEEVANYCADDVERTRAIYRRMTFAN